MKEREKAILTYILDHHQNSIKQLLDEFKISKRTLYYDIESLNYQIRGNGQIKNINRNICYIGKANSLNELLSSNELSMNLNDRQNYILYKILNGERITIDNLAKELAVAKNTIVQTLEIIKEDLTKQNLQLINKPRYVVCGDEELIRNLYLILMQEDNNLLNFEVESIQAFDEQYGLKLSDYATYTLAKFVSFLQKRIDTLHHISRMKAADDIQRFHFYNAVKTLLHNADENEQIYLCAYIASLPSLDTLVINHKIDQYVDILVKRFEIASAVKADDCGEFKRNIRHHLISSYYRIKYHFPVYNPSLNEIKRKHKSLFAIIKRILDNENDFPDFKGMREEEIGFIAAYFGGYLKGSEKDIGRRNKVLLVCPHGLMVSKSLEAQLYKYIPTIQIVDAISLKKLKFYPKTYDYIISTIDIAGYDNVIVVNPMMTRIDIDIVMEKLLHIQSGYLNVNIDGIMDTIKQNAKIIDEVKLRRDIERVIYREEDKEDIRPMLKDLINENRIQVVKHVANWKEAIQIASEPLLKENAIEQEYVDSMIESVNEHGHISY